MKQAQEYDGHPGFTASWCVERITITARSARTMNGYACSLTGGHCLPGTNMCPLTDLTKEPTS